MTNPIHNPVPVRENSVKSTTVGHAVFPERYAAHPTLHNIRLTVPSSFNEETHKVNKIDYYKPVSLHYTEQGRPTGAKKRVEF